MTWRNEQWFEQLYRDHCDAVHKYLRRRMPEGAEDLVSEVFTVAWRRRADVPEPALPWLYGVAANVLRHATRAQARQAKTQAKVMSLRHRTPTDPQMRVVEDSDMHHLVTHMFEKLSAKEAEVLKLWAWEELTPAEIAVALGVKPGTVRVRLSRARSRMATLLGVTDTQEDSVPPMLKAV